MAIHVLARTCKKVLTFEAMYQSIDRQKGVNKQTNDTINKTSTLDMSFYNPSILLKTFIFMSQNDTTLWLSRGLFFTLSFRWLSYHFLLLLLLILFLFLLLLAYFLIKGNREHR